MFSIKVEILEYLNIKGVVHNDIKPANLFVRGTEVFISGKLLLLYNNNFQIRLEITPNFWF